MVVFGWIPHWRCYCWSPSTSMWRLTLLISVALQTPNICSNQPDLVAGQTNDFLFKTRQRQRPGPKKSEKTSCSNKWISIRRRSVFCLAWHGGSWIKIMHPGKHSTIISSPCYGPPPFMIITTTMIIIIVIIIIIITLLRPSSCFPPLSWSQTPQSCRYTLKWFHWFRWTWQRVCIVLYIHWCICGFVFLLLNCPS